MTGSRGGGGTPPIRTRVTVSCEKLTVITVLVKPDEEVLTSIKVDDILIVQVLDGDLVVMYGQDIVGYVDVPEKARFISCLQSGTFYVADVLSIEGFQCKVRIRVQQL